MKEDRRVFICNSNPRTNKHILPLSFDIILLCINLERESSRRRTTISVFKCSKQLLCDITSKIYKGSSFNLTYLLVILESNYYIC